jgi:hypothetical protein
MPSDPDYNCNDNSEKKFWVEVARYWLDILHQTDAESDRGAVIVLAAFADDCLQSLLKARLLPPNGSDDELFDISYAPLRSYSAKIDLAYRIGVINVNVRSSLHLMRKLRNDFAHFSGTINFATRSVQNCIRNLFKYNHDIIAGVAGTFKTLLQENSTFKKRAAV